MRPQGFTKKNYVPGNNIIETSEYVSYFFSVYTDTLDRSIKKNYRNRE